MATLRLHRVTVTQRTMTPTVSAGRVGGSQKGILCRCDVRCPSGPLTINLALDGGCSRRARGLAVTADVRVVWCLLVHGRGREWGVGWGS